ncbi:MAG TPA: phage head closure protein [Pirellulales bacterium]|jgi:SPP1 family predicted phage head-tail adaptor|nr:phage head closure protein [Pirellulales bacterium]
MARAAVGRRVIVGRLNKRITIETPVQDQEDTFGSISPPRWNQFAACWAGINPIMGSESAYAEQTVSQTVHEVTIRYLPGINEKMRVKFIDAENNTRYFAIQKKENFEERNIWILLTCIESALAAN